MIVNPMLYQQGVKLPELTNPGAAADLLAGKQLVDQYGNPLTGTMPQKSAADLTASGASIIVPAGYYPSQVSKSVATATHPAPTLSRSGGTVTAKHVQSAGYTDGGTTEATLTITTQAGKTVTPGTSRQTAVASGRLTTGAVYVAGDANLKAENIKSGVSIFGVAGIASGNNPSRILNCTVVNNTNIDLYVTTYKSIDPSEKSTEYLVSANSQGAIETCAGCMVTIEPDDTSISSAHTFIEQGTNSINCIYQGRFRIYSNRAYNEYFNMMITLFYDNGTVYVIEH